MPALQVDQTFQKNIWAGRRVGAASRPIFIYQIGLQPL